MIDLAAAKAHLRVEHDDEDASIDIYLSAAKGMVEKATGKLLTPRVVEQALRTFPATDGAVRLFYGPVDGASAELTIAYDDGNGDEQALADFRIVEGAAPKLLPAYGESWPASYGADGSVRISYTAGYAEDEVPPELDQAVLMLVGHFYLNREAVSTGPSATEMPLAVDALIAPFRPVGLA